MALPVTVCQVAKELYGVAEPVLDTEKATKILCRSEQFGGAGLRTSDPAFAVAMDILEERIESL
jgi:hypothetical protein